MAPTCVPLPRCGNDRFVAAPPCSRTDQHGHHQGGVVKLAVGAIGVVFGDIGTSPLYAMRDTFAGHHPLPLDPLHVFGIVSLMFWSMMIIVTLQICHA